MFHCGVKSGGEGREKLAVSSVAFLWTFLWVITPLFISISPWRVRLFSLQFSPFRSPTFTLKKDGAIKKSSGFEGCSSKYTVTDSKSLSRTTGFCNLFWSFYVYFFKFILPPTKSCTCCVRKTINIFKNISHIIFH